MDKPAERSPEAIAGEDRGLSRLLRAARAFDELDRRLRPVLSEDARGPIQIACIDGDCLVLAAASPAWATRARLEAPALLAAARQLWPAELNSWRIIVRLDPR